MDSNDVFGLWDDAQGRNCCLCLTNALLDGHVLGVTITTTNIVSFKQIYYNAVFVL